MTPDQKPKSFEVKPARSVQFKAFTLTAKTQDEAAQAAAKKLGADRANQIDPHAPEALYTAATRGGHQVYFTVSETAQAPAEATQVD